MNSRLRLVLLHALPLDGSQWTGQMDILPGATIAPTLYKFGDTLRKWAAGALNAAGEGRLIVVGNSIGASCALEMARVAGDRISALVLVGGKAGHRPDPEFRDNFLAALKKDRKSTVRTWVCGFFAPHTDANILERACTIAEAQCLDDLINGVQVFHSRPDALDVLSNWKKILVRVRGEHDQPRIERGQMNGPQKLIAGCGHYVNLEQPQAFNAMLSEVIKTCASESEECRN